MLIRFKTKQIGMQTVTRSDAVLINIAGQSLTSDRLTEMTSTGGQTEAVRPGCKPKPGLTPCSSTLRGRV